MKSAGKPLGRIASRLAVITMAAAILGLSACSSGPKVFTNENPSADFSTYRTYNFEPRLGTDKRDGVRSILSGYLVAAADGEMQARGYQRSDNPDLVLNFYLHTKEKIRTTSSPSTGGYYGYRRGRYNAYGGYETQVTQYTEGTLNIDIVDNKSAQLAWEGIAIGRVNDKVLKNLEASANAAIAEFFKKFPYIAAGFAPAQATEGS